VVSILDRPAADRLREYKYRCAQAIVFGLPVIFLEYFGHRLGGPEAVRWVAILQALLAGWVMYVGAAGMLVGGSIRLLGKRFDADLVVALVALGIYIGSSVSTAQILLGASTSGKPLFHWSIILVIGWTALRWGQYSRLLRRSRLDAR
jgi:cation transport ATPase